MSQFLASNTFWRLLTVGLLLPFAGSLQAVALAGDWANEQILEQGMESLPPRAANPQNFSVGIPGEFERQAGLVLSWKAEEVPIIGTLLEIAMLAVKTAPILVLVSSAEEREHAETAFRAARINRQQVQFLEAPVDTIWARDFGPAIVRNPDGSIHFVDSDYGEVGRPQDDNIPPILAAALGAKCVRSLLSIEGGNLLSNGAGLCLTTSKTIADNMLRGYEHQQIKPLCEAMFQCREVAVLEPLIGEPTGHVDMFATFTSSRTVVIASIDPAADPVNSAVLDRNARKLSEILTPDGPLRVERIPMPAQEEGLWRSFTNVLYFNGVLMMPTYAGVDYRMQREAAETFRRLLPGWDVRGIDCTKLIRMGGAIHCVTLNLPAMKPAKTRPPRLVGQPERFSPPLPAKDREEFHGSGRNEPPFMFTPDDSSNSAAYQARPFEADEFDNQRFNQNFGDSQDDRSLEDIERRRTFPHPTQSSFPPEDF